MQRLLVIPALALAFIPIIASLCTQDFRLIKVQNIVEAKDVTGPVVEGVEQRPELIREKTRSSGEETMVVGKPIQTEPAAWQPNVFSRSQKVSTRNS